MTIRVRKIPCTTRRHTPLFLRLVFAGPTRRTAPFFPTRGGIPGQTEPLKRPNAASHHPCCSQKPASTRLDTGRSSNTSAICATVKAGSHQQRSRACSTRGAFAGSASLRSNAPFIVRSLFLILLRICHTPKTAPVQRGAASKDHKASYAAHAEAFVCYAFARGGRRHTHCARVARTFGCLDHHDLHTCARASECDSEITA
jgi:hypothetical protein